MPDSIGTGRSTYAARPTLRYTVIWSIKSLSFKNRIRYAAVIVAQLLLSVADILGVAVLALLIANLTGMSNSGTIGESNFMSGRLADINPLYIALAVGVLFVGKAILSFLTLRWLFRFLANAQSSLAQSIITRFFRQRINEVMSHNTSAVAFASLQGSTAATIGLLGSFAVIVSESFLMTILGGLLLFTYPLPFLAAALAMGITLMGLRQWLTKNAREAGRAATEASITGTRFVNESIFAFREFKVSGALPSIVTRIEDEASNLGQAQAVTNLIAAAPKFFLETALVLGVGVLFGTQLALTSLSSAATASAIFLVVGFRLLPSALRLLSASLTMRSAGEHANPTLLLEQSIAFHDSHVVETTERAWRRELLQPSGAPEIVVQEATFSYQANSYPAVNTVSLKLESGKTLAIVGPSGGGKSTLVDLILGLLAPQSGAVSVGGLDPTSTIFPDVFKVSYITQHVGLLSGSILDNLLVGQTVADVDWQDIEQSLERSHLRSWVESLEHGLDTQVGERGSQLSGGQRQRLGIARALITHPQLLVLDEATSALDSVTENALIEGLDYLAGTTTRIVVAHRLSTILKADHIAYVEKGRVKACGSFSEVRSQVEEFDHQARLLGL